MDENQKLQDPFRYGKPGMVRVIERSTGVEMFINGTDYDVDKHLVSGIGCAEFLKSRGKLPFPISPPASTKR